VIKVGDLVRYTNLAYPDEGIGLVLEYEKIPNKLEFEFKVRWTDHSSSNRDWYREGELELIVERRRFSKLSG